MDKTLGVIINNQCEEMGGLTDSRNLITLPVFGRFRMIDFALSNMVNSGISKVAVIASDKYRSLLDHLGTGQDWGMCSKGQPLIFMQGAAQWGTKASYHVNLMDFIKNDMVFTRDQYENVLIVTPNVINNINFTPFIAQHKLSNADITFITQDIGSESQRGNLYVTTKDDNRVTQILSGFMPAVTKQVIGVAIIKLDVLLELMEISERVYRYELIDLINDNIDRLNVQCKNFHGYHRRVSDVKSYFDINMEILEEDKGIEKIFNEEQGVYTKIKDNHPTQYYDKCEVTASYIASGCKINGNIEKTIVFREVVVDEEATIKNSIIMDRCKIGKNTTLEYVIADRNVVVSDNVILKGSKDSPVILRKEMVI